MENIQSARKLQFSQCQSHKCTINASNTCLTHKTVLCNLCTSVLHFDCEVKIKDEEGFLFDTFDAISRLAEMIDEEGINSGLDTVKTDNIYHIANINKT